MDNLLKPIELMMRVDNNYSDVSMVVSHQGKILKSVKKRHVAPGEMETLTLDLTGVELNGMNDITVELVL
jgi:hypothetical protein